MLINHRTKIGIVYYLRKEEMLYFKIWHKRKMNGDLEMELFDIFTEGYKDKLDEKKDLKDYLEEKTKDELIGIYGRYYLAGNMNDIDKIKEIKGESKENIINKIINLIDTQLISVFQFMDDDRMEQIKNIANDDGFSTFELGEINNFSIDIMMKLHLLGLIYAKKENEKTIIHMPNFVKNKIRNIEGNFYLDYYDDLLIYLEGMVYTYGVIDMKKAYEYISNEIPINFNKFNSIVLFTAYMELDKIYFKSPEMVLANIELTEDQISKLANRKIKLEKYDLKFFKSMADGTYLKNLKEYKSFRNYLKDNFKYDLNDDEDLRKELIQSYSDIAQVDERKALQVLKMMISDNFDIDDDEEQIMIGYINNIREKMPIWKKGGKIN